MILDLIEAPLHRNFLPHQLSIFLAQGCFLLRELKNLCNHVQIFLASAASQACQLLLALLERNRITTHRLDLVVFSFLLDKLVFIALELLEDELVVLDEALEKFTFLLVSLHNCIEILLLRCLHHLARDNCLDHILYY